MTNRAIRCFAISTRIAPPKQCARFLHVLCQQAITRELLLLLCRACYKLGAFFLQLYHPFLQQLKLSIDEGDTLAENAGGANVSQRGDQAAKGGE